ncbi:hypothetical protein NQ315_006130 [Exocentrus adspersus]|uniref:Phospholipase A2-like domain-containing protein n=1 Tax=Exocentrus adspersus TaxID=1586481 RepID=A0AAV8VDB1_9CUCU|nr:hypothetical protein NQ315_006130 [Exocentrus adspersus]
MSTTARKSGSGILDSIINNLPVELHIPGYRFCGPGTKLAKRLSRGDMGINGLDEACKEHDIAYSREKNLEQRHKADQNLGLSALGALGGGAAGIAKAVNDAKDAKQKLEESKRHNVAMEQIAMGKGLYMKPYKQGFGLFLGPYQPSKHYP